MQRERREGGSDEGEGRGGEGRRGGCSRVKSVARFRMDGVNGQQGVWRGEQEATQ